MPKLYIKSMDMDNDNMVNYDTVDHDLFFLVLGLLAHSLETWDYNLKDDFVDELEQEHTELFDDGYAGAMLVSLLVDGLQEDIDEFNKTGMLHLRTEGFSFGVGPTKELAKKAYDKAEGAEEPEDW